MTKKRGISETIGTLMILTVTVVGAVFISNMMQSTFFTTDQGTASTDLHFNPIQLTGYDTRDSTDLSDVSNLSNNFTQFLCTNACSAPAVENKRPLAGGTEFLVLHLRNISLNSVFLHNILINNEGHSWDSATAGQVLDVTGDGPALSGEFPTDGKFSLIPYTNGTGPTIAQNGSNEVQSDQDVRVIIKLSENIPQDIGMWSSLRILVNYGGSQPAEFIVLSGDAKW